MPATLLLRLPASAQQDTEWLAIDESGAPAGPRQRGPLDLAAAAAKGAKVIALAPATQVLLAEPQLPPGSGVKLARVVPFALEEQLTEDIDQLSFSIGQRSAQGTTAVAVVSREIMRGWMDALAAVGIEPIALYVDMSLLPDNPAQTVLWLENGCLAVRRPGVQPFAIEMSPVTDALVVAGVIGDPDEGGAEARVLASAILYLTREEWARVQDEFEGLMGRFDSLKVQLLPDGPLPWLARELAVSDAVNLLQGEFARTADYAMHWRRWRTTAFLAAGLLCTHVAAQTLQIRQANRQSAALDREIAQVFASAMPAEPMRDPRQQMQSRLERIRKTAAGPEYFLHIMQALSEAAAGPPATNIDALSFRGETLDMKVTAANVDALAHLSQVVANQGLSAEIQSSTPVASGVEAHVQIRASAARARR